LQRIHRLKNETINKKFWEELIAYFPLIGHGLHKKEEKWGKGTQTHRKVIL
jgi:hypothetical protein